MADAAQDKVEEAKETGGGWWRMGEELKKNPSTILEDAGEKLEVAREVTKEKLQVVKGAMEEKVEEVKEKMAPEKEDGSAAKKDDSE